MTELARLVDRFEDVTVRDLAWLLFAPDLLRAADAGAPLAEPCASDGKRDAVLAWLAQLDAALDAHTHNPKSTRLGIYAESLLEYFTAHGPLTRLIAANVPLHWQRRTIGECDFLLEDHAGARLHWELAVKFYLHIGGVVPHLARLSDYVGLRRAESAGSLRPETGVARDTPTGADRAQRVRCFGLRRAVAAAVVRERQAVLSRSNIRPGPRRFRARNRRWPSAWLMGDGVRMACLARR